MKFNAKALLLTLLATVAPAFAAYEGNYTADDMGAMGIDFVGHILNALIQKSDVLVGLLITLIIVGLITAILAAVFGVFSVFKKGKIF